MLGEDVMVLRLLPGAERTSSRRRCLDGAKYTTAKKNKRDTNKESKIRNNYSQKTNL